jgi:hypothetical protein
VWTKVLRPYWHDRRTNVPLALDGDEVAGMVVWVTALPEVASEVLDELRQTRVEKPSVSKSDRLMIHWSHDDTWVREHPADAAALIQWLADRRWLPEWVLGQALDQLKTALDASASARTVVLAAAQSLARMPYTPAATFAAHLTSGVDPIT